MLKIMQNFKATCLRSPCDHVISHLTWRNFITVWTSENSFHANCRHDNRILEIENENDK